MNEYTELLEPVDSTDPAGPDLESSPEYLRMQQAIAGRREEKNGRFVRLDEPPWKLIAADGDTLLRRSKDLRVATTYCHALLESRGLEGMADGLELIAGLLESFWQDIHPVLDTEDNDNPIERMNALGALADQRGWTLDGNPDVSFSFLKSLRAAPLVDEPRIGRFGLRDWRLANGKLKATGSDTEVPDPSTIDAAFFEAALETLEANHSAIRRAMEAIDRLNTKVRAEVGAHDAPDLSAFEEDLADMDKILSDQLARRGATEGDEGASAASQPAESAALKPGNSKIGGAISNRAEVVRAIDLICDYYRSSEPSSPVPILLLRAKRLVDKGFLEIIRDLTPAGAEQANEIAGGSSDEQR